ncbi:hypothetical protein [Brevibacterium renqingii]|uniref:hypothetical protein n=1 Tax=Brevibacterium renqingii TaxID=2776916 RepID=UPI001AE094E6|nr:hypothetical protein [Brevibacterium renqingii]
MEDFQLLVNLSSGSGGAIIGVIGTLAAVKMQNRAADKRDRAAVATHFYSRAHGIGVQSSREMRRAGSLDLPMEPGWDIQLIESVRVIELLYDAATTSAAQATVDALTEVVEQGTVGSMMRLDSALSEFAVASGIQKKSRLSPQDDHH